MSEAVWSALGEEWVTAVGMFNGMAVHERLQASRSGFALMLLYEGNPVAFVKVRESDGASIENEFRALEAVSRYGARGFDVPRPVANGGVGGWQYLMTAALAPELHRMPVDAPLAQVLEDVRSGLSSLARPKGTPAHWEPMHGDFTPWNLRQRGDGSLFLIDWEDASWGPPGADEVLYRTVEAALTGKRRRAAVASDEARQYWIEQLRRHRVAARGDSDSRLVEELLGLLED